MEHLLCLRWGRGWQGGTDDACLGPGALLPPWDAGEELQELGVLILDIPEAPYNRLLSRMYSESYWKVRLQPLWEAVSFREAVQGNGRLASQLTLRLGRHAIHSADDVSHLLARLLPPERV